MRLGSTVGSRVLRACGASSAYVVIELVARTWFGVPTVPDLLSDRFIQVLPGPLFSSLLEHLGSLAKPALFVGLLVSQLSLTTAAALLAWRWGRPGVAATATAIVALALLWFAGDRQFQVALFVATQLLGTVAFVVVFAALEAGSRSTRAFTSRPPPNLERRQVILLLALMSSTLLLARRVVVEFSRANPSGSPAAEALGSDGPPVVGLPDRITSSADFYVVSKNLGDPDVDIGTWRLRVDGSVDQPLELSYGDILAMEATEFIRTLECISNDLGGNLISNGRWRGVRLASVLERAGFRGNAQLAKFTSVDGYEESITVSQAEDPATFLTYELGGRPLPREHGFPLRVLGAETYGMKNPKWLNRIELVQGASPGFWEQQGWKPDAAIQTYSRIDAPDTYPIHPGTRDVLGIAFAGARGIYRVEVSLDGGATWDLAELFPTIGPQSWSFWRRAVTFAPGSYTLQVRATDGTGAVQTSRQHGPFPDGVTGYQTVRVTVRGT